MLTKCTTVAVVMLLTMLSGLAADPKITSLDLWSGMAPGETTREVGTPRANAAGQKSDITRIEKITQPTLDVFLAEKPSGAAVIVLPGGGYTYVVPDLEGSEAAPFLNQLGISVFVVRYRTGDNRQADVWQRSAQDAQRAMRIVRANAQQWHIDPEKVGVLGFSAGGQVASYLITAQESLYPVGDKIDELAWQPNFCILAYPWRLLGDDGRLKAGIQVTEQTPKTIIIHTHDDTAADSLGSIQLYTEMKKHGVDAELHIYRTGGHGYGIRPREGSRIHQWPTLVTDWLVLQGLAK
ncbi:MAG: alpha/beta hydrolase [Pirellulaceae bacterium]